MFFNEVYVDNEEMIVNMQNVYDYQHKSANHLLNITDKVWEEYKYMYNKLKASDRIKISEDLKHNEKDIIINFDLEEVNLDVDRNVLTNIQQIIEETKELGEFEYGPFKITINNKIDKSYSKKIITNPKVKPEHLYTIH